MGLQEVADQLEVSEGGLQEGADQLQVSEGGGVYRRSLTSYRSVKGGLQ